MHQLQACRLRIIAHDCDEHICCLSGCGISAPHASIVSSRRSLPSPKPTPGVSGPPISSNKMVVSSSAAYSALCTDFRRYEFKRRLCVVVQASTIPGSTTYSIPIASRFAFRSFEGISGSHRTNNPASSGAPCTSSWHTGDLQSKIRIGLLFKTVFARVAEFLIFRLAKIPRSAALWFLRHSGHPTLLMRSSISVTPIFFRKSLC